MPRTARASEANLVYHVLNRGNGRAEVFHKVEDYAAFRDAMVEASVRLPMRLIAYCLMPNHFHLVLRPHGDGDLSRWMHWLLTTHMRRYLRHYHHTGHVWQGRFKAFPVQDDEHLATVIRYVERNALRAGLAERAEDWPWSSLANPPDGPRLDTETFPRAADWIEFVNTPMTEAESEAVRLSIRRDRPYGSETWTIQTANRLGLEYSIRPRGRPARKESKTTQNT
jgi:putative transposase